MFTSTHVSVVELPLAGVGEVKFRKGLVESAPLGRNLKVKSKTSDLEPT